MLVATTGLIGLGVLPSCATQQCQGDFQLYGQEPNQGAWTSSDTWESNPNFSPEVPGQPPPGWLDFPAQRTWDLIPNGLIGGSGAPLKYALAYVSPAKDPNRVPAPGELGDQFALAAGNLAEVTYRGDGLFVHNDTCAHYYLRVVVVVDGAGQTDSGALGGGDAGDGADAEQDDAAPDAPIDASSE